MLHLMKYLMFIYNFYLINLSQLNLHNLFFILSNYNIINYNFILQLMVQMNIVHILYLLHYSLCYNLSIIIQLLKQDKYILPSLILLLINIHLMLILMIMFVNSLKHNYYFHLFHFLQIFFQIIMYSQMPQYMYNLHFNIMNY